MTTTKDDTQVVQTMPIDSLCCRPQVRTQFDEASLLGLAQTIKDTGILQPLMVRREGSEFVVVEGERRLRAAKAAGLTEVLVMIDDRELCESEILYRQLVTNSQRQDLTPLEKARAIDRLVKLAGLSAAQVAVKLGVSSGTVSKLLALLELPESVQSQVANGSLPLSTAYAVSLAPDSKRQLLLASQAATGELRREEVAKRARSRKPARRNGGRRRQRDDPSRIQIPLGGGRSIAFSGPDLTLHAISEWLHELLTRIKELERPDMELTQAVKALTANAS